MKSIHWLLTECPYVSGMGSLNDIAAPLVTSKAFCGVRGAQILSSPKIIERVSLNE
jgi:hypothetical protein